MLVHTGPGKSKITRDTPHVYSCCLFNFDIDGAELKQDHKKILDRRARIMAFVRSGGSVSILGLASTTYTRTWDLDLSRKRAEAVANELRYQWQFSDPDIFYSGPPRIQKVDYQGKDLALRLGVRDNVESEFWRGVWIRAWDNFAPAPVRLLFEDMGLPEIPDQSVLPAIGTALDIASWISGLTIAELVPVLDMAISIADTVAALPVAWATGDNLKYINDFIVGYNNAMQDMADAFSDRSLSRKPESTWPPIPHPTPHLSNQSKGEQDGCDKAYQDMMARQSSPKMIIVRSGTETRTVAMTGKFFLRILSRGLKDQVAAYYMLKWNAWLRSKGMKPWPTRP